VSANARRSRKSTRPIARNSDRTSPEKSGEDGSLLDRNPPMGRPRGVGSIANFNLPKYPRGPTTGEFHPRRNSYETEPLGELVPCAIPSGFNRREPSDRIILQPRQWPTNPSHTTCSVNERRNADELKTFNNWGLFILQWGNEGST